MTYGLSLSRPSATRLPGGGRFPYNCSVAKYRPARGLKKQQKSVTRGRLIGCVVVLAGLMFLFFLVLARLFRSG